MINFFKDIKNDCNIKHYIFGSCIFAFVLQLLFWILSVLGIIIWLFDIPYLFCSLIISLCFYKGIIQILIIVFETIL